MRKAHSIRVIFKIGHNESALDMIRTGVVSLFLSAAICISAQGQYKNFKIDEFASDQMINPSVAINQRGAEISKCAIRRVMLKTRTNGSGGDGVGWE